MTTAVEFARQELVAVVGEPHVVSDSAQCAAFGVDGMVPKYVVYPPSAEQVAAVLKWAADHDLAVIPCRNATKLAIGNIPRRYDIALSLKEMNNIWHYEPADLTASVEPGVKFTDFQYLLARHNLWLPLDPPCAGRASLGGILATNSTGPLRLRYGAPRDMVLGMKIATPEGKVIKTGGRVVKNVAGYDFSKLFVGSFGTLGVIVEASLKLYPKPAERATFVIPVGSLATSRGLRGRILNSPLQPLRMVLLNGVASSLVRTLSTSPSSSSGVHDGRSGANHAPRGGKGLQEQELWFEAGGSSNVIGRYARECEELAKSVGTVAERLEGPSAENLWDRISDFRTWTAEACPNAVIVKAALPISVTEEFLSRSQQEAASERMRVASFAQTGVGIVHLALLDASPLAALASSIKRLRKAAEELHGTVVVERCSLEAKTAVDVWGAPGDDLEMMRKIKCEWDPKGILAPGRLLGSL